MLNAEGNVADATGENVFMIRDGVLTTPPTSAGALEGVTRDSIMKLASDLGIPVTERNLVRADLYTADEGFVPGTAAGALGPAGAVDVGAVAGADADLAVAARRATGAAADLDDLAALTDLVDLRAELGARAPLA